MAGKSDLIQLIETIRKTKGFQTNIIHNILQLLIQLLQYNIHLFNHKQK